MTHFSLNHDRDSVHALHQAHADMIRSFFSGLRQISADPYQVRMQDFGPTRTMMAQGHDWYNRVTLIGDESFDRIDEILTHFEAHRQKCHIEWNPAVCYRPDSWNVELEPFLRERGFRQGGFRCVWHRAAEAVPLCLPPDLTIRRFASSDLPEFIDILMGMENKDPAQRGDLEHIHLFGEAGPEWHHYVAFLGGIPCGTATLFTSGSLGYLAWGQTLPQFQRHGCYSALIQRRVSDACAEGCQRVFTVTDFNIPSAANLQKTGFQLAYNYVMLIRDLPAL